MFTLIICSDTKEKIYSYERYLLSDHWKSFRRKYILENGDLCEVCGDLGQDLHHTNYDYLGNESFDDVIFLCRKCHKNEHISLSDY